MNIEKVNIYIVSFTNKFNMSFLSSEKLEIGDKIVAETSRGIELGTVISHPKEYNPVGEEALTFIIRKAEDEDIKVYTANIIEAKKIQSEVQLDCDKLGLNMRITSCEYTLDRGKLMLSYISDDRVDFRELLKILAAKYRTRIDLRQIGARDKAKLIGGIGVCGLPLCCSTFLNEFDAISITMAKNQMLALNIPKLSGQCGKLLCCLKYENDTYNELKKDFPRIGIRVKYNDIIYKVSSINILTKLVHLESLNNVVSLPLEDFNNNTELVNTKEEKNN